MIVVIGFNLVGLVLFGSCGACGLWDLVWGVMLRCGCFVN